jgi:tetratricopeptide (TPR) repeat protein
MKKCFLILFTLALVTPIAAQNWNDVYSKELEAEEYLYAKNFEKAAQKYKEALKLVPTSNNLKYKIGYSYLLTFDKKNLAIEFLEQASNGVSADYDARKIKEENAPPEALYHLGRAYQITNQFDKAISVFTKYKEMLNSTDPFIKNVDNRIESCRNAPRLLANEQSVKKTNLGETINNKNANFNAVISGDGRTMAYTTLGSKGYDVYVVKKKGDVWDKPRRITDDIRGSFLKTTSISYDGSWLYFVDDFAPVANIYDSFFEEGWVKAKKLGKPINSKFNDTHAAISPDGKTLYFTSDRPGGQGGLDIYKSSLDEKKGKWGEPVNLGSQINTEYNENTPFVSPDGKYLFFSSEGHKSIGGYDIYYVDLNGAGSPVNLGYPINNSDDNLFYFPETLTRGYMARVEEGNIGPLDLYQIQIVPTVNLVAKLTTTDNSTISNLSSAKIKITESENSQQVAELTPERGSSSVSKTLQHGIYRIEAKVDGFVDFAGTIILDERSGKPVHNFDIALSPIPKEPEPQIAIQQELPVENVIAEENKNRNVEVKKEEKPPVVEAKPKEEPKPKPKPKEEPKPKVEPKPKPKETPTRAALVAETAIEGQYTVQIMALLIPVPETHFKNISGVAVEKGNDGYYRYFFGSASTRAEALEIQKQLKDLGYKNTFVKKHRADTRTTKPTQGELADSKPQGNYTIQIFALKKPVEANKLANVPDLTVVQGDDSYYRYFSGSYSSFSQANSDLPRIVQMGYKGAFIRKR